ncbi:hypothetical protein M9H77_20082 [Catharanthus roseus]|uniref:Uncharacterized protein n=1 Tax=Catharanthus roseus TaxID=4058 RepID=A0ACC0AIW2_CATRO|nr:hypothetical protein M9H77_20082 [Catharanthus roseus]
MSVLRYPEGMNSMDLQIWDNAAFDNGESEDSSAIVKSSWSPFKPSLNSSLESMDSFSSKENRSPLLEKNSVSAKSQLPIKSILQNGAAVENSRIKSVKANSKLGFVENSVLKSGNEGEMIRDDKKIDQEIEEIEKEISRLASKLEALKVEKAEKIVKTVEKKGGRVIPAKFMNQKQSDKNAEEKKKVQRRGLSIGPSEIFAGTRRGMSLGPAEIMKSRQIGKQESMITPIQSIKNRRKSCFWKLQDIDEAEKVTKERRKSLSLSPKSRKANAKMIQSSRQAATTVASRKTLKKEDAIVNSIQPKKLFKDGEKSAAATNKKPIRPGRVIASRYNQSTNQASSSSAMRKRSLPENDQESKRCDKKRSLSVGKSRPEIKNLGGTNEGRVKKRWEIPSEIVVHRSSESETSPPPTTISVVVPDLLPRIRTSRGVSETPRDSGPAKRVAELIGKKSFFSIDEEVDEPSSSVCQALHFAED